MKNDMNIRQWYIGNALRSLSTIGWEAEKIAKRAIDIANSIIKQEREHFSRIGTMYRQGDVLIARIDAIPIVAIPAPYENNHAVLAHGEVTGHKHQLTAEEAKLFAHNDNIFLRIVTPIGFVRHEEHSPIELPMGDYQVIKQREASDMDDVSIAVRD